MIKHNQTKPQLLGLDRGGFLSSESWNEIEDSLKWKTPFLSMEEECCFSQFCLKVIFFIWSSFEKVMRVPVIMFFGFSLYQSMGYGGRVYIPEGSIPFTVYLKEIEFRG